MKRLAMVLALVAMGACQTAEQQTQTPAADTSHKMAADTAKKMAPAKPAAPAKK